MYEQARRIGMVLIAMLPLPLGACNSILRHPLPDALLNKATIPGLPTARFWGDTGGETVLVEARAAAVREREFLHLAPGQRMPDAHYLAISGGGSDGAFGAGLLCGWTAHGTRPTFKIVTGISTGALIAPFAFVGPELDATLKEMYTTITTDMLLETRSLLAALMSDAIADTGRLRKMLDKYVTDSVIQAVAREHQKGRILLVGTTNMDAQRPVIWNMGVIAASGVPGSTKLFRDVMLASASIPAAFPPVMVKVQADGKHYDEMHCDGGTAAQVFLYPASISVKDVAREAGVRRNRHVYVIRNSRIDPQFEAIKLRMMPIASRAISTLIKTQGIGDLYRIYLGCQRDGIDYNVSFIPPTFTHVSNEPFDTKYMQALFSLGYDLASKGYKWEKSPPGFAPTEMASHE